MASTTQNAWVLLSCLILGSLTFMGCGDDWDCGDRCMVGGRCVDGVFCRCPGGTEQGFTGEGPCIAVESDPNNCGSTGNECPTGSECVGGHCQNCPEGQRVCDTGVMDACVSVADDARNCGACGASCPPGIECVEGECQLDCDDDALTYCLEASSCVDLAADDAHCGACGQVCPADSACVEAACICETEGLLPCDIACVDPQTDPAHCGGCGQGCTEYEACQEGQCICPEEYTQCGEACADLQADLAHCGDCAVACFSGEQCLEGACVCEAPREVCGESCVPVGETSAHCAGCDQACEAACVGGSCQTVAGQAQGFGTHCALFDGGKVTCWGSHGPEETDVIPRPTRVIALDAAATAVVAGKGFACALLTDQSVSCWGRNDLGQLGRGTFSPSEGPAPVAALFDVVEIGACWNHACARKSDGTAHCWGRVAGVSEEDTGAPTPSPVATRDPVVGLVMGGDTTCFIEERASPPITRAVECYGSAAASTASLMFVDTPENVDWGGLQGCLIEGDTVECLGYCVEGQCGPRGQARESVKIPVEVRAVVAPIAVAAGGAHSCAIDGGGVVWCWGRNDMGQLGRGTVGEFEVEPAPAALPVPVERISAGVFGTCASAGGRMWCWGADSTVRGLANGDGMGSPTPVEVPWW